MWKTYLRQIRYLLKENKFFSLVYILGTALSITMVMLILITYYINTANIGVEDKRDRMFFFTRAYVVKPGTRRVTSSMMAFRAVRRWGTS